MSATYVARPSNATYVRDLDGVRLVVGINGRDSLLCRPIWRTRPLQLGSLRRLATNAVVEPHQLPARFSRLLVVALCHLRDALSLGQASGGHGGRPSRQQLRFGPVAATPVNNGRGNCRLLFEVCGNRGLLFVRRRHGDLMLHRRLIIHSRIHPRAPDTRMSGQVLPCSR